jgi:hypothetical protein
VDHHFRIHGPFFAVVQAEFGGRFFGMGRMFFLHFAFSGIVVGVTACGAADKEKGGEKGENIQFHFYKD